MIKTQIQLPDALYQELKRVAREREMSLAEVLRRGAEYITQVYLPLERGQYDDGLPGPFHTELTVDPFSETDWRYNLNQNVAYSHTAREVRRRSYGKRKRVSL